MKYLLFIFLLLLFNSCDRNVIWEPDFLVPLLNTQANIKDVSDIEGKVLAFPLLSDSIGYDAGVDIDVPSIQIDRIGPVENVISEFFLDVHISEAEFTVSVSNTFPISIGAGTKVVVRSFPDTSSSSVIFSFEIDQLLEPGNSISLPVSVNNVIIPGTIQIYIEDFQSPGQDSVQFELLPSNFEIEIDVLRIDKVRINTEKSIRVEQFADYKLDEVFEGDSILDTVTLNTTFLNEVPMNIIMQVYFLSGPFVIDSLFPQKEELEASMTDNQTGFLLNQVSEKYVSLPITSERIEQWEKSDQMIFDLRVNTFGIPDSFVTAADHLGVSMRSGGRFQFDINLNEQ